jgi:hypothetical protein
MADPSPDPRPIRRAVLLGLGLDNDDRHVRITRGPNFRLFGGSDETHSAMQRTAIRVNEKLRKRGKSLEEVDRTEFRDLLLESSE